MALLFFCPPRPVRAPRRVGRHLPFPHVRPLGQPSPHLRIATRPTAFPQTRKIREPVIACPVRRESVVPQAVATSHYVAGHSATIPQVRNNLDLATINPVCRESLVAAGRCHLRSRWWLFCLHSAKLEYFGRATIDRLRYFACQLILNEKSCRSSHPDPVGAQSKRERTKKRPGRHPGHQDQGAGCSWRYWPDHRWLLQGGRWHRSFRAHGNFCGRKTLSLAALAEAALVSFQKNGK